MGQKINKKAKWKYPGNQIKKFPVFMCRKQ